MIFFVIIACLLINVQIGASILGDGFTTFVDHFNPQDHESVHFVSFLFPFALPFLNYLCFLIDLSL